MMEKYNIEETMAFTGHRLIEPGRVEEIKAQLRIKIKALRKGYKNIFKWYGNWIRYACRRDSPIFEG